MKKQNNWAQELLAPADIKIGGRRPWDIQVKNDKFFDRVLRQGSLGLGESYMEGWWECEKLDEFFNHLLLAQIEKEFLFNLPMVLELAKAHVFNLQIGKGSFKVGRQHYDLGNDFFEAMLGRSMAYSCGYWASANNLDEAEFAKFDLICRKLNLQKGQRILDIGSGWGGFAKYAAEKYGVSVIGVTVSKEQAAFAGNLCKGLPVEFRLQDYRKLNEQFDHIVSVGMFEHVGVKNYNTYMQVARRCLKKDGLFLLHTIGAPQSWRNLDPWITKYIFPNSALPSLKQIAKAAENSFIIEDVHNFGPDYDKTLMAWYENFKTNWPTFQKKYGQTFYRMWQYYLLSCAGSFRARKIQLWQIVLSPNGVAGGYKSVR